MVRNGNELQLNDNGKLFTTGITHVHMKIKKESTQVEHIGGSFKPGTLQWKQISSKSTTPFNLSLGSTVIPLFKLSNFKCLLWLIF